MSLAAKTVPMPGKDPKALLPFFAPFTKIFRTAIFAPPDATRTPRSSSSFAPQSA